MAKIYTKTGDKGQTTLVSGKQVDKDCLRIETYGSVDELNSHLGMAISLAKNHNELPGHLINNWTLVQNHLFNIGSLLACDDDKLIPSLPNVSFKHIQFLENSIDEMTIELDLLKNFILAGGSNTAAQLHIARCVCRRTELLCIRLNKNENISEDILIYLNRLSDYLFTAARFVNKKLNLQEQIWQKD